MLIETPLSDYILGKFESDIAEITKLINLTKDIGYQSPISSLTNIRDALMHYAYAYEKNVEFMTTSESNKLSIDEYEKRKREVYDNIVCMKEHLRRAKTDTLVNICTYLYIHLESETNKNGQRIFHNLKNAILRERLNGMSFDASFNVDTRTHDILGIIYEAILYLKAEDKTG